MADTVTIVFQDRQGSGRVGRCELPWIQGKSVRGYLKDGTFASLGMTGYAMRCKMYNSKKSVVRLYYVPTPGDLVVLVPVRSA